MTYLDAALLGIVEGLTEYLPISSTAHLILASEALGIAQTDFIKTFEIAIQSGAIAAVLLLYWRTFLRRDVLQKIAVAFIPTGIIGFILYPFVKTHLIGNIAVVLAALLVGGVALILFEKLYGAHTIEPLDPEKPISYRAAFMVGIFQSVAMIPGVSRSAATIVGGMLLGLPRTSIVEFSFLLAVPTLGAATALDLFKNYQSFSTSDVHFLAIGLVTSFATAVLAIRFFLQYVRRHSFTAFGVYRIVLVVLFLLLFA